MSRNDEINAIIRKKIDEAKDILFECKSDGDPAVVAYDGIIAEGDVIPDVLFLLKEANDGRSNSKTNKLDFSNGFDFIEHARPESKEQAGKAPAHWDNLCYWTQAYYDAINGTPHKFLDDEVQKCGGLLGEIAIVNIKKVPGGQKTKEDSLAMTVKNTVCKELIRKEISLISPKIVVCCGTFEYAKKIFADVNILPLVIQLECGTSFFVYEGIVFLDFIHPTQYGVAAKRNLVYAYAKEVFSNLVRKMDDYQISD